MDGRAIGLRVHKERLARGWSLRQLALQAQVSHGYINQLENGDTPKPGLEMVLKLYKALHIDTRELTENEVLPLTLEPDDWETRDILKYAPNTPIQEAHELLGGWDDLDAAGREAVEALMDGLRRAKRQKKKEEGDTLQG